MSRRSPFPVPRSVFARFLLGTAAAVLVALLIVAVGLPQLTQSFLLASRERELLQRGDRVQTLLSAYLSGRMSEDAAQLLLEALGAMDNSEIWLVDRQGDVVLHSRGDPGFGGGRLQRLLPGQDAARVLTGHSWTSRGPGWWWGVNAGVSVAVPVSSRDGAELLGAVVLNSPAADVSAATEQLQRYLFWAAAVGLLAAVGLATVMSRNISRPVNRMIMMARGMAEGDFGLRAPVGTDEIGQLGESLNMMASRLEASLEESRRLDTLRRDLVANVSHDLRSPVTAIRGYVEPLLDGTVTDEPTRREYLETIRSETDALTVLVSDLLELSRLEAGAAFLKMERVDLGQLAREARTRYEVRARTAGVSLRAEVGENLAPVRGDEGRLARIFNNLLDNALRFTPVGGEVLLTVRELPALGEIEVSVADDGPGIPPEDLPFVWDRFYKGDKARRRGHEGRGPAFGSEGSGLGLAIVRQTAQAHGGHVSVESRPGEGSRFSVFLPVSE